MRIELTIATPGGHRDVAITAPPGATPDSLRAAVAEAAGRCGITLPSEAGLPRTGAVLGVEGDRAPDQALALFIAGGRSAGTVRPLQPGCFVLGRADECDLTLDDESVSRRHVELAVGRREVTVRDLASTNGCDLDGVRPGRNTCRVPPGAVAAVG